MKESFDEIVARVKRDAEAADRQAFADLLAELREYTYSLGHAGFWTFDLSEDEAIERLRKFIDER